MRITRSFYNESLEFLEAVYEDDRQKELDLLARLYNLTLGPVSAVKVHLPTLLDQSIYTSSCNHSPMDSLIRDLTVKVGMEETILIPGGGKGCDLLQPILGALGEIAERLLAVLHFEAVVDRLEYASCEELRRQGRRALAPEDLPLFAPQQYASPGFGYVPFTSHERLRWITGRDLLTGDDILVPAQLVLMYYKHHRGEPHIGYPTTGGLAFHHDRRRAILHGLYEFIERDAINVRWYARLPPIRISVDLDQVLLETQHTHHLRFSTPYIGAVEVYLNTLDAPVAVLTAIAIDRSRPERAFLGGGGASSRRERALEQALFELGQSRTAFKVYRPSLVKNIQVDSRVADMTDFFDAALFYGYAPNLGRLDWYRETEHVRDWSSVATRETRDTQREYDEMLGWLRGAGWTPVILEFGDTWPDLHLVKVLVPQLTQASVPSHPYLGHPRFYDVPHRLGLTETRLHYEDLNTDPVPFP